MTEKMDPLGSQALPKSSEPGADQPAADLDHEEVDLFDTLDSVIRQALDDVRLTPMQRLGLLKELAAVRKELQGSPTTLQRLKLAGRLGALRRELGATAPATTTTTTATDETTKEAQADAIADGLAERKSTSHLYDFDPNRKQGERKKDNAAAMALLARIREGTLHPEALSDEDKMALAKYSGTGGNLVGADGKKGSAYEYYTPKPIAEGVWALLRESGFMGGRVSDPCGGVGIFGATAPVNAAVDAVELNETSGRVNQLVNDGPGYSTTIAPYERVAAATPDETYDAIVSNVPFGDKNDRGGNQYKDPKYQNEPIQNYFILRSLEKLKPGGLACFITPPRCVSGKGGKEEDLRIRASYMAEFVGAYRLPNKVFGTAAADTMTDVVLFRKYRKPVLEKIAELREQNSQVLIDAGVLWQEFIKGTYFVGEGHKHILGTLGRAKGQFGDKDVLNSDLSISDIAKLIRKFPKSRIQWDLLDATETEPIVYRDGDTVMHAGTTMQMQNGRLVLIKEAGDDEHAAVIADLLAKLTTPLGAVNSDTDYTAAMELAMAMVDAARALEVPDWMRDLLNQLQRVPADAREAAWGAAIVGLGIDQAMEERQGEETGFDYLNGYPILSDAMKRVAADAKRPPTALSSSIKTAMKKVGIFYSKADGYSGVWRGDVAVSADIRDAGTKFAAALYQAGGGTFVPVDEARKVYGEAFDPMGDDAWCISRDGTGVAKADDYFVGNYGDFMAKIGDEIAAATDDDVRAKLLRQKFVAESRIVKTDPSGMTFTLFSPFVTMEERAEFLRRFVDKDFVVGFNEKTGKPEIQFTGKIENGRDKLLKRFALYLSGTRLTLGGAEFGDEAQAIKELRRIAETAGAQFNSWVKANPVIMGRLYDLANDPARVYFRQTDDESPLEVPGLNPDWKSHGYQNAYVRQTGRDFSGINGFDVGLGKTSTALIAIQHAQAIGTKKRTMIVVPNSVLSNWRKEAGRVYASADGCLYVGLRFDKAGSPKADTKAYDADLTKILEGKHSKIFVTYEAFQRLRLRQTTAEAYDAYLASVDSTYASSDNKADDEKGKSLRAAVIEQLTSDDAKSMAAPFFEDLGIDSLVIDEAHFLKNSSQTIDFKGGKFLSLAPPSARGIDAQAKCWYVRDNSPRKDGVILLTATPITNSPLEIYSMLSLAVGHAKLNDLMNGIKGADEFMATMCELENRDEETLDGLEKPYDVFVGLNNVGLLRNALAVTATIKDASDVGKQIVMPSGEEKATAVTLPKEAFDILVQYKEAFRFAIDTLSEKSEIGGSQEAYEAVAAKFGEPMELIGHPFNLIQKMSLLIADPELDKRATFYNFSPAQADKVADVVARWNAKPPTEDRARPGPQTSSAAIVGEKTIKDGDDKVTLLKIAVLAKIDGQQVILDTTDSQNQAAFEAQAEKAGVDFDVTVPPKLAALIENFQYEEANPRGVVGGNSSGRVRQLIFCDTLAMHTKIKRILAKKCGVAASSIAIITGKVNNKPEDILQVQDGFNEEGEGNKYRVIIANEKAEVGINLQKGTQAIHHLTLGWTPDSLTQRNGRGLRQGNETERVRVYQYDADGTFDCYKRTLVGAKSTWIDNVMSGEGGDNVAVTGGLTRKQMESMIDSVGDSDAMSRQQAKAEADAKIARAASTQGKQAVVLGTIKAQRLFLKKYEKVDAWAAEKIAAYVTVRGQASLIEDRINNPKATASAVLRNQNLLAELQARQAGLERLIESSVAFFKQGPYDYKTSTYGKGEPATLQQFVQSLTTGYLSRDEKSKSMADRLHSIMTDKSGHNGFTWEVSEDGEIGNEWQSEIDMANSLIESSKQDFARMASQDGGHSTHVLDRAMKGQTAIIDGKVACVGAFIERNGELGVLCSVKNQGLQVHYLKDDAEGKWVSAADEMRAAELVLPGATGYDALVTRAAGIEDTIAELGAMTASQAGRLFSAVIPAVGQRRSKPVMVVYDSDAWFLPSPTFPRVVKSGDLIEAGAVVVPRIANEQARIVTSTIKPPYGSIDFVAASDAPLVKDKPGDMPTLLVDYCKAHGLKLVQADLKTMGLNPLGITNDEAADFNAAVIAGSASVEELTAKRDAWLTNELLPQYDLGSDTDYAKDPLSFFNRVAGSTAWDFQNAARSIQRRLEEAARAAAAANQPAPTTVAPLPAAPAADQGDPNRIVSVIGNTLKWKDMLKSTAVSKGSPARWQGSSGPVVNFKATGCWNVTFAVWQAFLAAYPAAEQDLQLFKA